MKYIVALPISLILIVLQTTIGKQLTLLHGSADLLLVWLVAWGLHGRMKGYWIWALIASILVGFISALPWYAYLIAVVIAGVLCNFAKNRLWEAPLLTMFSITLICSVILYTLSFVVLKLSGISLEWSSSMIQVIVPSVFLNLLLSIPIFVIVKDTAIWLEPSEAGV
jgi:hypothetical protein